MEELKEDEEFFNKFLVKNEDNKKDFFTEPTKKENDDILTGWGSWAGDTKAINTKDFLRKKRYQQKQDLIKKNESSLTPLNVKVNNSFDKKVKLYNL
jgi:U3 small nucleolar RNA-associated protein 14